MLGTLFAGSLVALVAETSEDLQGQVARSDEYVIGSQIYAREASCFKDLLQSMHKLNSQAFLSQVVISFHNHHLQCVSCVPRVLTVPPDPFVNYHEAVLERVLHPLQPSLRRRMILLALWPVIHACPVETRLSVCVFLYNLVDLGEVRPALP
jgi:hypothetical protein